MDDYGPDPALVNQAPAGLGPSGFDLGQWRDIGSAPQGEYVLCYFPMCAINGSHYATARRNFGTWYCDDGEKIFAAPLFWMPLPPPPSTERIDDE